MEASVPCKELKTSYSNILKDLMSMSLDVIKKSNILLQDVESLDRKAVDNVTNHIRTLLDRVNTNIGSFVQTLDAARNTYRAQEPEISPKRKFNLSLKRSGATQETDIDLTNSDEEISTSAKRRLELGDASKSPKKENAKGTESDGSVSDTDSEKTVQYFDVPVRNHSVDDETREALRTALDELDKVGGSDGNRKIENFPMRSTESASFDFDDDLAAEMDKLESFKGEENSEAAETTRSSGLPEKSKFLYEKTYSEYVKWCELKKTKDCHTEEVLQAYFTQLSKERKPSTLWAYYSMLKATIKMHNDVDIGRYTGLFVFLKNKSQGFRPKKSKVFTKKEVYSFLYGAPDDTHLMTKVALIFGIAGACRRHELTQLEVDDIQDLGLTLLICLRKTKNTAQRRFNVIDNNKVPSLLDIYRKYASLRPPNTDHRRFFLSYKNGKCTKQVVGKNMFGALPRKIAMYLKLPNPELYTGHSLRQSSASLLADTEDDVSRKSTEIPEIKVEEVLVENEDLFAREIEAQYFENAASNQVKLERVEAGMEEDVKPIFTGQCHESQHY